MLRLILLVFLFGAAAKLGHSQINLHCNAEIESAARQYLKAMHDLRAERPLPNITILHANFKTYEICNDKGRSLAKVYTYQAEEFLNYFSREVAGVKKITLSDMAPMSRPIHDTGWVIPEFSIGFTRIDSVGGKIYDGAGAYGPKYQYQTMDIRSDKQALLCENIAFFLAFWAALERIEIQSK